ncbi:MAG: XRE family transcriptional regulator [Pelagibacteraceae bacterium BACL5 MAG-120705-bin12]|jgi:predicted transcriptional regulator/DNA-binding Xre family transcriptional regulator|uniref:helix-turn-helix domain-containing protein n=1 Tax=Candidatus Pelagibacter sp. TaxID=2024849 RepID=UPI0007133837|nr:MAG: XRE family transcriptional regulator [Pelagibacteraceae bacterium BACL5 MAG-121015-bin10]KRO60201.1 MAG: XRE family transcriptional regulator [Pelagibacteraceae bacterium BACL5 MAG-121128-bin54]KRO61372.1 MAG: XRE family transcriptional regulator [Pelagibacteraceae bacterium BACL5 MAG-120705-bin12]KRO64190.1 MAG: XRE family transcriptional regulator [Pelagibacteraceae bacterium BACL5 MAG-120820-bin39]KRO74991.1 MAG: XRE family transcriptional regulator [Pelagibacteraceae bacterium BACL5
MSQLDLKIGPKIKAFRRQIGLQANKLAEDLKISPSYLNLIEGGKRKIDGELLLKVCDRLNIQLSQLTSKTDLNLENTLSEILDDQLFEDLDILSPEIKDLVSTNPKIGKAIIRLGDILKKKDHELINKIEKISGKIVDNRKNSFPGEVISDFLQENKNFFPKLENFANEVFEKVQKNNRTRYIALCDFLKSEFSITVKDIIPDENKPFSKIYNKTKKELLLSDYSSLETKKLNAAAQISQEGAYDIIEEYLSKFTFPSEESKKLTKVALLNYTGAAILMPYKLFHSECKKLKYDLELLQNTFATSFEQVAHRVTCLQDPKLPGIPFHFLRVDMAGNISKRLSLSGIEIPRYGGACPRWNVYSAFTRPGVIQAAVSKMTNGEKYICIARTVEKGIGRFGKTKSILSIGLGCEAKYSKDFVYTENININDKSSEIPIGVSCRTCDRLDCSQRAFPPLHKKFDVDINTRGVSIYVNDNNQ